MPSPSLPNDIAALQALLLQRDEQLVQLRETVSTLELALSVRTLEIEQLKLQIAKLKRMQFGRKSEKIDRKIKQLETRLEDLIAEEGAAEQKQPTAAIPGQKSVHQPLPEHLVTRRSTSLSRRSRPVLNVQAISSHWGRRLGAIGNHRCCLQGHPSCPTQKACARCDCIVQAPAPSRPIERGYAGPGLLANLAVGKYANHLPLHRQSVIYARKGLELDPSTTGRWMGACGVLVRPLVEALRRYVLAPGKVHSDDTPMPVLAPGNGQTKTGRLWVYVRDDRNAGSTMSLRFGSLIRRIGRGSIHSRTWPALVVFSRQMHFQATIKSSPMAWYVKPPAWPMPGERCTICMSKRQRRQRLRRCAGLVSCMQSKRKSEASHQTNVSEYGKRNRVRCSTAWKCGCVNGC